MGNICWAQRNPSTSSERTRFVLTDSVYNELRHFLANSSGITLKDTIIIKYDYNRESCWNMLDRQDDAYIKGIIRQQQQRIQKERMARPGISVFMYREPGNNINKLKKWDPDIQIDRTGNLQKWLFGKRKICGNSVIVLPDRTVLLFPSDAHFQALQYVVATEK